MKTRIRSELHVLACYLVIAVAALVAPVHVANAAEAPVLTLSRSSATYVENDASFYVDASLTITGYTGNISGARVSIDSGYRSTEDSLQFTPSGGISGSFNSSTGILALSGSASASAYETALRSVRYVNNSESPSTANRSITVALSGGSLYYSANGHYYEFVSAAGLSWTAAKSGAASRTLYGLQGYLATITSSGENAFLTEKVSGSAWIGASDAAQEGVWKWMTGPEAGSTLSYSNWSSGEPNNSGGNEDYAHMMSWTSPPGMWNDLPDAGGSGQYASTGYMVEYGGMPGDPTVRLSGTLTVAVQSVNDPPQIVPGSTLTITEDSGTTTRNVIAPTDPDSSVASLTYYIGSPPAKGTASIARRSDGTTGQYAYTPTANANGADSFAWYVSDGQSNSNVVTQSISITAVNDRPSFTKGADQTVLEDCGSQAVAGWATNISAGPADEAVQTLTFTASASNAALFSTQPAIAADGTLTYTPALNASGSATITVTLKDNGGTANGGVDTSASQTFTITVTSVNDSPVIAEGASRAVTMDEDGSPMAFALTLHATDAEGDTIGWSILSNPSHGTAAVGSSTGVVTYAPTANWNGTDSLVVQASDGHGGTAATTVTVTVNPRNDAPVNTVQPVISGTPHPGRTLSVTTGTWDDSVDAPLQGVFSYTYYWQRSSNGGTAWSNINGATTAGTYVVTATDLGCLVRCAVDCKDTQTGNPPDVVAESMASSVSVTNAAPVIQEGASVPVTMDEDGAPAAFALTLHATDADGDTITWSISTAASHGTAGINSSTGVVSYAPAANWNGSDSFGVQASDVYGGTASTTVTITVTPVNDVPSFTKSDNQTVLEDCGSQTVSNWATNISAGPANESSQTLTFTVSASNTALFSAQPAITAGGTLTFTPAPDANGSATITVTLKDNGGTANGGVDTSASQTVTITVTPVIDIVDDAVTTNEDTAITFNAITGTNGASADNFENSSRYISAVTQGSHSVTVAFLADGSITYTPAADWNGTDSFTYTVTSPAGITETATVTITVTPVADIADDVGTTLEDQAVSLPVLANDTFEGSPVITGVSTPTIGSVTIVSGSSLLYAPSTNANGTDSFTYTVTSPAGITETATVTITVTPVNDVPSFTKSDNQTVLEDCGSQTVSNWATNISAGPANESSQTLTFTVSASNTALFSAQPAITAGGTLTFTPAPDANGSATITVTLKDNGGTANGGMDTSASQTVTITVTPVNDVPSFTKSDNQTVLEDCGSQTVSNWATNISAGPANESSQTLTFTVSASNTALFSAQPAITAGGTLTFTPAPDANGSATITVTLKDNGGTANGGVDTSASQTVTITVTPVIDIVDDAVTTNEDTAITFNAITGTNGASADNFENSSRYISAVTQGSHSVTVAFLADGSITYTPAADWNGTDSFTYTVTSPAGITETATVTITVTPVADIADDVGTTLEDQAVSLPVLANDTFEGSPVITGVSTPTIGSVTIVSGSSLLYAPSTNANGTDSFTYTVTSPAGITETATVTITVTPVNDVPSFTKSDNQTVLEDCGSQTVSNWATNISAGPANESSQTLTFTVSASNTALFSAQPAITAGGTLTFTPAPDANGSATITVTLKDNGGTANGGMDTSASQTVTITVTPVNDVPSFTKSDNQTVLEDCGSQTVSNWATNISAGPANESSQTLTFTVSASNTALFSAQPAITAGGTLTFTPAPDANGSATITVTLKDNGGTANGGVDTSASQTFTITVTPVNDVPSFTEGANQTVLEDCGSQTVSNWATNISAGPANESSQTLTFTVSASNTALFSVQPAITAGGTLTFTPAPDANGSATITVTLKDNGGTANGGVDTSASQTFTITVTPVNDVPSFTEGANQTVLEDCGSQTVSNWATNISAGPASEAGQQVAFTVATDNPALFAVQPSLSPAGTLTFTPAPNRNGVAHLTVTLTDDGTRGTAALTTPPQFAALVVNPINDPPVCLRTPAISGKGLVGTLLTADPGSWDDHMDQTPGHVALRIQWLRGKSPVGVDAVPITGATELTYEVQKQDVGWYLGFQVVAMDDGEGTPRTMETSAYAPVFIRGFDADTVPPTLVMLRDLPVKVSGSTLVLDGLVWDAGSGVRSFSINGTPVIPYADGSFHEAVPLHKGDNALELTAVDNAGNTWTHTYHVTGVAAAVQQQTHTIVLTVGRKTMSVDGHATALDVAPVIREGRTMVPFRAIVEGLGGSVSWNATTRQVTIKVRGQTVILTIDRNIASVNGHTVSVDPVNLRVTPFIASGRTYIPVRFLTERLGMMVGWNAKTQTVTITWND